MKRLSVIGQVLRAGALSLSLWGGAAAAEEPVVVELFTSQGCSSCPPADLLLRRLGAQPGVIALALHVDYWDYIGWADSFADPAFTARQKAYAAAQDKRSIYTPQMMVQGAEDAAGTRPMDVMDLIARHRAAPRTVMLEAELTGDRAQLSLHGTGAPADVVMVRYTPEAAVQIRRGENAGQNLPYSHIVTSLARVAGWDGRTPLELEVPVPGAAGAVLLVQETGHGPILAAAKLR